MCIEKALPKMRRKTSCTVIRAQKTVGGHLSYSGSSGVILTYIIYFTIPGQYIFFPCIETNQLHQSAILFYEPTLFLGQNFTTKLKWTSCQLPFSFNARIESNSEFYPARIAHARLSILYFSFMCFSFDPKVGSKPSRFFFPSGGHKYRINFAVNASSRHTICSARERIAVGIRFLV